MQVSPFYDIWLLCWVQNHTLKPTVNFWDWGCAITMIIDGLITPDFVGFEWSPTFIDQVQRKFSIHYLEWNRHF